MRTHDHDADRVWELADKSGTVATAVAQCTEEAGGSDRIWPPHRSASTATRVPTAVGPFVPSTSTESTCAPGPNPSKRRFTPVDHVRAKPSNVPVTAPSIRTLAFPIAGRTR